MIKDQHIVWKLWSCGPWPRRVYEQWCREVVDSSLLSYGYEYTTEYPSLALKGTTVVESWAQYLQKYNIAFELSGLSTIAYHENPIGFFSQPIREVLKKYGTLRITP